MEQRKKYFDEIVKGIRNYKTYSAQELGRFLRENNISPTEAINIIKKYKFIQT